MAMTTASLRDTGIPFLGQVPWGRHFCHFYETKQDLLDTILPFFKAGLEAREFCLWLVAEPLTEGEARSALRRVVPDLDSFLADGSIEFHDASEWNLSAGVIDLRRLIEAWDEKLARALQRGFTGMRANGCESWLQEKDWRDFSEYEELLNEWIAGKPMIVFCSYPLATAGAAAMLDVARTHNFALAKRKGAWEVVETPEFRETKAQNSELRIRHRRQCALADLGQATIRATDLAALMDKAAAVVAETLNADLSAVAELLAEREEFRVLAGVGWEPGYVGGVVSAIGTPGRYMLSADEAIVVDDLRADTRFERPQVLLERGVVSLMAVIIRGQTRPWGLLSVHSRRLRSFSPDEVGFLQSVANVLALAIERHELEVARRRADELFRAVVEDQREMIVRWKPDGTRTFVNGAYCRTFGKSYDELVGTSFWPFVAEPYREAEEERIRSLTPDSPYSTGVHESLLPDGTKQWQEWSDRALFDGQGRLLELQSVGRDITERVRLLENERASRAEAETALERLRAIHSITDAALARLGLDDLLRELLARLRSRLAAEIVSIRLIDEERKEFYLRAIDGVPLERVAGVRIPLDAIPLDAPFLNNDLQPPAHGRDDWYAKSWSALNLPLGVRAGMSTPLVVEGTPIGIIGVTSSRARFSQDDLHLLQLVADRAAPAIERGRLMETVRAGREQLQALSRRLLTAQEEERRRLAVELHDELGQVLTAVKINLASLERQSGPAPPSAHLRDALASVDRAMERVRDLALDLRPSVLDDLGLGAAVRAHVVKFARTTGIETHLSIDAVPRLRPDLEIACFRVAQEALTNVARHAQARNVWVDLRLGAEALELRVRDDGIGFDADLVRERAIGGASMGLLGMQERVALAGGEFELSTRPEGGTEVRARFRADEKAGAPR